MLTKSKCRQNRLIKQSKRGSSPNLLPTITFLLIIILATIFLGGQVLSGTNGKSTSQQDKEFKEFATILAEVYTKIKEKYVEDVSNDKLIKSAIEGMIAGLDGNSQFLDSDMLSQLEKDTSGEFSGIGIHIAIRDGILTVIAPIPGTPAAKAGLQPWDRIVEIEGKSTEGITLMEAVKKLTGPPGTTVNITVYREGEKDTLQFTITRAVVKVQNVYWQKLEDDIGYIRLAKFSEDTGKEGRRALEDLKAQGMKSLILDLRFNTGGLLTEAVNVAELFVPKGKLIVSTRGNMPNQNREYISKSDSVVSVPMVVLVNKGSASASEIVAGALKDLNLGIILAPKGQTTFGKGSVQTIEELESPLGVDEQNNPRRCAIRLTTAHYYTPAGTNIEGKGITPDIVVELSKEHQIELIQHGLLGEPRLTKPDEEGEKEAKSEKEKDSKFYLEKLKKDKDSENKEFVDIQLQFAVDLLKGLNVLSKARE